MCGCVGMCVGEGREEVCVGVWGVRGGEMCVGEGGERDVCG